MLGLFAIKTSAVNVQHNRDISRFYTRITVNGKRADQILTNSFFFYALCESSNSLIWQLKAPKKSVTNVTFTTFV